LERMYPTAILKNLTLINVKFLSFFLRVQISLQYKIKILPKF
jgi:hypothetical protein